MNLAMRSRVLLAVLLVSAVNFANAANVTIPDGLNPGDQFHLAFVTAGAIRPISIEISDYDAFVQSEADAGSITAPLGLSWKAIGSTATVDAIDHVPVSGPIYLVDFTTKIADDQADLWDGTIDARLNLTQNGAVASAFPGNLPWTGTRFNGRVYPFAELGSGLEVAYGSTTQVNSAWVFAGQLTDRNSRPLYSISESITVPPSVSVPEAVSPAVLSCLVGIGWFGAARRRLDHGSRRSS